MLRGGENRVRSVAGLGPQYLQLALYKKSDFVFVVHFACFRESYPADSSAHDSRNYRKEGSTDFINGACIAQSASEHSKTLKYHRNPGQSAI
ncbi:MAG: hypothetical protein QOD75_3947 [Blastocatellia bacterium]|nr:hypothetical protein [Blastocatellia bacterium]